MSDPVCGQTHEHAAKCYAEGMAVAPMLGATTWSDLEAQTAVLEQTEEVQELTGQYNGLVQSIISNPDLSPEERVSRLTDAASGYAERVGMVRADAKAYRPGAIARWLGAKAKNADGLGPDAYAVVPDPDEPGGWKLRIDDASHISGAIQALSPAGFRGQKVQLEAGERTKAIGRIRSAIGKLDESERGNLAERVDALKAIDAVSRRGEIALMRGASGDFERFVMWGSNQFEDRVGDIFPADAITGAIDRFNAREGAKGHVNIWHVGHPKYGWGEDQRSASDWGEIEHAAYVDGFVLVEGKVTDAKAAGTIEDWGKSVELGSSIEYAHLPWEGGGSVYSMFEFDRVSVVPRAFACNPWNPMMQGARGMDMPYANPEQRDVIAKIWGESFADELERNARAQSESNKSRGLAYKSIDVPLPAASITFSFAGKDETAEAVSETPTTEATAAETSEVPAWVKALQDQNAAILARLDQSDAAVKAIGERVGELPPAAGIFGRSVTQGAETFQNAAKEAGAQDAMAERYQQTGQVPTAAEMGANDMGDWGVVNKIAASIGNGTLGTGTRPAGQ